MHRNWYVVYTKPKWEKKIAATFSKKKIENFLPLNVKQRNSIPKNKMYEPLFDSYIFLNVAETEIAKIKKVDGVVSLVYWKGAPARVNENEINAIREFTRKFQDIHLEKTFINPNEVLEVINGPKYSIAENLLR